MRTVFATVASHSQQSVRITLRMIAEVTVGFINLAFMGDGLKPDVKEPYDHNLGQAHPDYRWIPRDDGSWNGQIIRQPHRKRGQHIRIGLNFTAPEPFNGHIEVFLSCEEGAKKSLLLPFEVKEGWPDKALRTNGKGNVIFSQEEAS